MSYELEVASYFGGFKTRVRSDENIGGYSVVTWDLNAVDPISVEDSASEADKSPCVGITGPGGITSGNHGFILLYGFIENLDWAWTPQVPLYLIGTDGAMGEASVGAIHQQVAVTITATKIFFNPQEAWAV